MKDCYLKHQLIKIYEFMYEKKRLFILRTKYHLRIMSSDKTLEYIQKHKCSIVDCG